MRQASLCGIAWLLCAAACATAGDRALPAAPPRVAPAPVSAPAPVAAAAPAPVSTPEPEPAPAPAPAPAPPSLPAYREAIAAVLSPAARAELQAVAIEPAVEAPCHASAFSAVLTDAVARHVAAPAFRSLGHGYSAYAKLARDALPAQAHLRIEWQNFTLGSPAIGRCEVYEQSANLAAWCERARLGDVIGTAVASRFSPSGVAEGAIPLGNGEAEGWSIALADVIDAALQLGVPRAAMERALLDAFRRMPKKLALSCELVEAAELATVVPIVFHVAQASGAPVLDDAALGEWMGTAGDYFELASIAFAPEVRALPADISELRTVRERRALKRLLVPRKINVFIVARILDPVASTATQRAAAWQGRQPSGLLAGAHIEAEGQEPETYVILSAQDGGGISLTHELGHFFGVAHHRDPTNIMSYGAERDHFDDAQLETFQRTLRALVRRGVLDLP